jgi:hypothetical protein
MTIIRASLPLFPDQGNRRILFRVLPGPEKKGRGDMGGFHQVASASLALIFAVGMIVAAQRFMEFRSARTFASPHVTIAVAPF